jgi:glycosyltransferase involved in cell wall biosynthesis
MALIAMAVYDLESNGRSEYTKKTLESIWRTIDFRYHRIFIFDNGSCQETQTALESFAIRVNQQYEIWDKVPVTLIRNEENIGTACAINECWEHRYPGENCIKMDNDVVFHQNGWVDEMEEAIARESMIGIISLKRKDLSQSPWNPDTSFRSELIMLPQEKGQKWSTIEKVNNTFGTCQMYSSELLDRIGYLIQVGPYGWDDHLSDVRCLVAGKWTCFLPHIEIDHIDTGGTEYTEWKVKQAGAVGPEVSKLVSDYQTGIKDIYYDGGFKKEV